MAYKNEEFDNVFQILDAIIYQTGCLAIVEKHSSSFNEEDRVKAEQLMAEQKKNVDQLWDLYQSKINPIMQNMQSVGKDLDKFAKEIIIAGEKYEQASLKQQSVEENVASQTTAINEDTPVIKNDTPAEVAPVEKEHAVVETPNVPLAVPNEAQDSVDTNVSAGSASVVDKNVQSNETESNEFILTPIEDDVVTPSIEEKEQNVAEGATTAEGVVVNPELTPEVKESILSRYIRMTTEPVKAILVTSTQYQKLSASRDTQKQLSEAATSEVSTEVQPVVSENADNASVPDKQKELQEMLAQANNLYKEGKVQESQELFAKVGAINKELQAQTSQGTNAEGNTLVKK